MIKKIVINKPIKLGQFLKWQRIASTGGESKYLILNNQVTVNHNTENRRGYTLKEGDLVKVAGNGSFLMVSTTEDI